MKIENLSDDFHTYVMEWDKDSIKLMVDDKLVKSIDLNTTNYANGAGIRSVRRSISFSIPPWAAPGARKLLKTGKGIL